MKENPHREAPPITKGKVLHWPVMYDIKVSILSFGKEESFRRKILDLAGLRPGDSVLDIGCGTGTLALAARKRVGSGGSVFGIDASPEMIMRADKKARRAGADVEFRTAPAEALPFPDKKFDVVLSTVVLHHLPGDILVRCLREIGRVLKKGGRLLVVDFGSEGGKKGLLGLLVRHESFDLDNVADRLKEHSFDGIDTGKMGFFNLHYLRATSPGK